MYPSFFHFMQQTSCFFHPFIFDFGIGIQRSLELIDQCAIGFSFRLLDQVLHYKHASARKEFPLRRPHPLIRRRHQSFQSKLEKEFAAKPYALHLNSDQNSHDRNPNSAQSKIKFLLGAHGHCRKILEPAPMMMIMVSCRHSLSAHIILLTHRMCQNLVFMCDYVPCLI